MKRTELKRHTPLVRKTRIKRVSDKRKKLMAEVGPERRARKEEIGQCMVCRNPFPPEELDCDEIARGAAREACLRFPELQLVSCRECHTRTQPWKPEKRIALIVAFDIDQRCAKYCELAGYAQTHVTRNTILNYLDRSRDINGVSPVKFKAKKTKAKA